MVTSLTENPGLCNHRRMNYYHIFSCSLVLSLSLFIGEAPAQEVLCVKKTAALNDRQRVRLARSMTVREGECRRNEIAVLSGLDAASVLAKLRTVDGTASELDADTLDGVDSSQLATTSALNSVSDAVDAVSSSVSTLQTSVGSLTTSQANQDGQIATNSSSVSTLNGAVEDLGMGPRFVRVGTSNSQYTDLATAIAFVESQVRTASNRWLIKVGPGTFELDARTDIPEYVELQGSGIDTTVVASQAGVDVSSVLRMGTNTTLSQMTVRHSQVDNLGITSVVSIASGATGDVNDPTTITTLIRDVKIEFLSDNPSISNGISRSGPLRAERIKVYVANSSSANRGITSLDAGSSDLLLVDSEILVDGGDGGGTPTAILDQSTGDIKLRNVRLITGVISGGVGLQKAFGTAQVIASDISSPDGANNLVVSVGTAQVSVLSSTISASGGFLGITGGTVACHNTVRYDGTALDSACANI